MKTDKEKMLAGEPYLAFCNELVTERARAKEILFEYNNLHPSEMEKRTEILKHFLGATGKQLLIEQPFRCDYGYNIRVGENFYANMGCTILDEALVTFGECEYLYGRACCKCGTAYSRLGIRLSGNGRT